MFKIIINVLLWNKAALISSNVGSSGYRNK